MSQEFTCTFKDGDNRDFMPAESWRILRIMSEFVESFDRMGSAEQLHVSVFGSARTPAGSKYYDSAEELGKRLVQAGYGVITGGGPGIMEAASKGAFCVKSTPAFFKMDTGSVEPPPFKNSR